MATEKQLIDAHDLWSDIMMLPHNGDMISSEEVEQAIKDAPTVDSVEVVHGRWIARVEFNNGERVIAACSNCNVQGEVRTNRNEWGIWHIHSPHCPNCGAKMDLKVEA